MKRKILNALLAAALLKLAHEADKRWAAKLQARYDRVHESDVREGIDEGVSLAQYLEGS